MKDALGDLAEFSQGELSKIATSKWLGRTTAAMTKAIEKSFSEDVVLRPVMTNAEIKHRFAICAKVVIILRRDLGWTMPRIFDELNVALRSHLDGIPWNPENKKRKAWIAPDSERMPMIDTGEGDLSSAPEDVDAA